MASARSKSAATFRARRDAADRAWSQRTAGPRCSGCVAATATILLTFAGRGGRHCCFTCADKFVRAAAHENVASGGTVEESVLGYYRWRVAVGNPCTVEEAREIVSAHL